MLCIRNKNNHDLRIVAPLVLVPMIFKYFHDPPVGAHLGIYKTIQKIKKEYFWDTMRRDITECVRRC